MVVEERKNMEKLLPFGVLHGADESQSKTSLQNKNKKIQSRYESKTSIQ